MPDAGAARELVQRDVEAGIGSWLVAADDIDRRGFRVLEPFDDESAPLQNDGGTVVVPWAWVGRHEAEAMGFRPTGLTIEVRGVTIVSDADGGPTFSRFVDWVSALADMGVSLSTRGVLDDPQSAGVVTERPAPGR